MKKLNHYIQNYLVFSSPLVFTVMIWAGLVTSEKEILNSGSLLTKIIWELLSWNLILWFVTLIIFLVMIIFLTSTREQVMRRLANIQERDEREIFITGQASRKTFISTLGILIVLLFLSIFNFNIRKLPADEIVDGRAKRLSITLNFKALDESKIERNSNGEILLESKEIPLSKSSILLSLILWQIVSFRMSSRKLQNEL